MKKLLIILLLYIFTVSAYSQREAYNWYFGNGAGLSFAPSGSTVRTINNGALASPEGCAAISDTIGGLLFYTNGTTIWNKNHTVMLNGSGLNGNGDASQSSIIIPNPQHNGLYYVFTLNSNTRAFSYSTIDIRRAGGLGAVIEKNRVLIRPITEKLTATLASDGVNFFVTVHGLGNNVFYSYSITASGVNTTPYISMTGSLHNSTTANAKGQMKISPDGRTLAIVIPDDEVFQIFDYNAGNGTLTNPLTIPIAGYTPYGIEFSPDSKILYVSTGNILFQYTIESKNSTYIINSREEIARANERLAQLQLAPDGKIYIASLGQYFIARISKPNENGANAGFSLSAINLNRRSSNKGLPAFVQSYMTYLYTPSIINACENEDIQLRCTISRDADAASFRWSGPKGFSSTEQNPMLLDLKLSQSGYYKIRVILGSLSFEDSILVHITPAPKSKIVPNGSTELCYGDTLRLYALPDSSHYSYRWSTGESTPSILITRGKKYYLTVEANACTTRDSIEIKSVPAFTPLIIVLGDKEICEGDTLLLQAYPQNSGNKYYWSTGDTTEKILITKGGKYSVTIERGSCRRTASTEIISLEKPATRIKALGPTSFCTGDSVVLVAEPQKPNYLYHWSTGETAPRIVVKHTGRITLTTMVRNACKTIDTLNITAGDDLKVKIKTPPPPFCEGREIVLIAEPISSSYEYLWSTGETNYVIRVKKSGVYSVRVKAPGGCEGVDTLNIIFASLPKAIIAQGGSGEICSGDSLLLEATNIRPDYSYFWSTGDTTHTIQAKVAGLYSLIVSNKAGCTDTAVFELKVKPAPKIKIIKIQAETLCRGDSAILIARTNIGNRILWSTGETKDTIVVKKTALYTVKVTNAAYCSAFDSILVIFNPYKEPEIESERGFAICEGEEITLKSVHKYKKYLWSTGDTTASITINTAGTYYLTISDTNGCTATTSAEIKNRENLIEHSSEIDFAQVLINTKQSDNVFIRNIGVDTLIISDIFILGAPTAYHILSPPTFPLRLATGELYQINIEFTPKVLKHFADSLVIEINAPCQDEQYIRIDGYGSGLAEVSMPDTTGIIGKKDFRIPLRAKIEVLNEDIINLTYSAKIKFYADIFLPKLLTNGIIRHDTIIAGERILTIQDSNVILTRGESVLTELSGMVLLGRHTTTPFDIYDLKTDNDFIDISTRDGSLKAQAVCMQNLNIINTSKAALMIISPNPANEIITVQFNHLPQANYNLRIYSTDGRTIANRSINIRKGKNEFELDLRYFATGTYIVRLSGGTYILNEILNVIK